MKRFLKILSIIGAVILISGFYFSYEYNSYINSVPDQKNETRVVEIMRGESIPGIINKLDSNGVISGKKKFYYFAKFNDMLGKIRYGEYEFTTSMKPYQVLQKLAKGEVKKYKVTIPEGYNIYQVAAVLADVMDIDENEIIVKCLSKDFALSIGVDAPMLEGYLFPDTYYFTKSMSIKDVLMKMVWNYRMHFPENYINRANELDMTVHEVITLASIIEKETSYVGEMPMISAVFHNRLKINMKLQSDPTVIYGIPDFDGNVTRKHLKEYTPYNTYKIKGFPPTPIANPGAAAINAALFPADVPYLFFVSKNNGQHYFSKNYKDHKKAVYKYQINGEKATD